MLIKSSRRSAVPITVAEIPVGAMPEFAETQRQQQDQQQQSQKWSR